MPNNIDMPVIGQPEILAPSVTRVIAPNASPMTYWGTNTYFVGYTSLVVIDPGPADPAHLASLLSAIDGREVAAIAITHSHVDHSPLADALSLKTGAKIYGFGDSTAGRSDRMLALAKESDIAGGEGVDREFVPDKILHDGEMLNWPDGALTALHTPGHFCNHLSFLFEDMLFSGDHIMGWASTLISPPDGDLAQYRKSLDKLQGIGIQRLFPGHGADVTDPETKISELQAHRDDREAQIHAALSTSPQTLQEITAKVYHDTPKALLFAASRNTFAHLVDLYDKNEIFCTLPFSITSQFSRKLV